MIRLVHFAPILVLATCAPVDDLAARRSGDLSNPPAVRGSPIHALVDACGTGPTRSSAGILRLPYVQQVSDRSAKIVWTTPSSAAGTPHVELTRPDGSLVSISDAIVDASARPVGARQLIASFDGLEPDSPYCYAIRNGDEAASDRAGLRTAPAEGGPGAVRFVAWGDSGDPGVRQLAVLEQLGTVPFDLALVMGDVAYERGTRQELENSFFGIYGGLLRHLPVYPVAGNHDYATDDAAPLREAFVLPENGAYGGRERWFSFDRGDVHFIGLDTELIGDEQAAWLELDLAASTRTWTVVFAHRPPFSSGHHGPSYLFQATLLPLLEEHGVDLVLAGHDHHYERFEPVRGVHHVVSGGGGRETRAVGTSSTTVHAQAVIHFLYVTVEAGRMALHAIDGTGREFDSLVIER